MTSFDTRRQRLRKLIREAKVDALLVTNFKNVTYLTGFTGDDSYLLVTDVGETLVTDMRFASQLEEECPGLQLAIRGPGERILPVVGKLAKRARVKRLGIEAESAPVAMHETLAQLLSDGTIVSTSNLVERLRVVKDKTEIELTRDACRQAERAFEAVRALITPSMTESDVATELEYRARQFGAKGLSFPAIVAVGARAALPHARPTTLPLSSADFVLIDWGASSGLYVSDLTRVLVTAKISPKLRKVYGVVLTAQLAAIDAIRPGVTCETVDHVARKIISKSGLGEFGHGLGHGIGLEIHEAPRLTVGQKTKLRPGMIVTVEPGIYLPGWGGVRIEDDILVTRTGCEVLTGTTKNLDDCVLA
jgi:Xaa-Pro aminopeptidase